MSSLVALFVLKVMVMVSLSNIVPAETNNNKEVGDMKSKFVKIDHDSDLLKSYQKKLSDLVADSQTKEDSELQFLKKDKYEKLMSLVSSLDMDENRKNPKFLLARNKYEKLLGVLAKEDGQKVTQDSEEQVNYDVPGLDIDGTITGFEQIDESQKQGNNVQGNSLNRENPQDNNFTSEKSKINNRIKIDETHPLLNSKLDELLAQSQEKPKFLSKAKYQKLSKLASDDESKKEAFTLKKKQYDKLVKLLAEAEELQQRASLGAEDSRNMKQARKNSEMNDFSESYKDSPDKELYSTERQSLRPTKPRRQNKEQELLSDSKPITHVTDMVSESYKWLPVDQVLYEATPEQPSEDPEVSMYYLVEEVNYLKDSLVKLEALYDTMIPGSDYTDAKKTMEKEIIHLKDKLVVLEDGISDNRDNYDEMDEKYQYVSAEIKLLEDQILNMEGIIQDGEVDKMNMETHKILADEMERLAEQLDSFQEKESDKTVGEELQEVEDIVVKLEDIVLENIGNRPYIVDSKTHQNDLSTTVDTKTTPYQTEHPKFNLTTKFESNQTGLNQTDPEQVGQKSKPKPAITNQTMKVIDKDPMSRKKGIIDGNSINSGDSGKPSKLDKKHGQSVGNNTSHTTEYVTLAVSTLALLCVIVFMFFVTIQWRKVHKVLKYDKIRSRESIRGIQEQCQRLISDNNTLRSVSEVLDTKHEYSEYHESDTDEEDQGRRKLE